MSTREPLPDIPPADEMAERFGLEQKGPEYVGPCPLCGGDDRFHVGYWPDGRTRIGCRGCMDGPENESERAAKLGELMRLYDPERFDGDNQPQPPTRQRKANGSTQPKPKETNRIRYTYWTAGGSEFATINRIEYADGSKTYIPPADLPRPVSAVSVAGPARTR